MVRFVFLVCFVISTVAATPINDINDGKIAKKCTRPHEIWKDCVAAVCRPFRCNGLGRPVMCPSIRPPCPGGCVCEEGFVLNAFGDCMDAKTCPSCGGDPNAQTGCGNPNCVETCASLRANKGNKTDITSDPAPVCDSYCEFNGCDCRKGYILNTDVDPRRCVFPEECNKRT